jgi:hypothetical protein
MKRKSVEWIRTSLGTTEKNDRAYIGNFHPGFTVIRGSKSGYSVYALKDFEPGEILEEVPVLTLHTTLEELIQSGENADPVIANYCVPHPGKEAIFSKEGTPLILGLGNFLAYRKSEHSNVSYNFDPTFNIITVRATKQIPADAELFFPQIINNDEPVITEHTPKKEKKMGCGCGKKKAQQQQEKPKVEKREDKTVETNKFKSMVDGKDLKTIKVD